jgi:hypothetical protein
MRSPCQLWRRARAMRHKAKRFTRHHVILPSHDSHNLTVFGGNAEDMAAAANAVISAGGGMAVASEGACCRCRWRGLSRARDSQRSQKISPTCAPQSTASLIGGRPISYSRLVSGRRSLAMRGRTRQIAESPTFQPAGFLTRRCSDRWTEAMSLDSSCSTSVVQNLTPDAMAASLKS